ncbi:hypothetical protein B0H16DRAFT_1722297 [Mycena metata]|uniref:Uncharacterized protein n=1 Tax=Mycena metata TaxID=1033252 RepID=A0AAD7J4Q7_9AGAR|nr:hypothetical protein B0H16DRAFT_1722297 [Mycena metata]
MGDDYISSFFDSHNTLLTHLQQPSASPSSFGRLPAGHMCTPSNPTSPLSSMMSPSAADFSIGSPPRSTSRPPSRNACVLPPLLPPMPNRNRKNGGDNNNHDSDSDSDEDKVGRRDMVFDHNRSTASSTVSMMPQEHVEALQRVNDDLARKLADTERMMQGKLAEQEADAAKREEKESRSKERQNSTQIGALEAEVVNVAKQLETSKVSYNNLQRQYMDQCASAEKYRNDLREHEETLRSLCESASLTQIEIARYAREHKVYAERITQMERELAGAMQAHVWLEEQTQENMLFFYPSPLLSILAPALELGLEFHRCILPAHNVNDMYCKGKAHPACAGVSVCARWSEAPVEGAGWGDAEALLASGVLGCGAQLQDGRHGRGVEPKDVDGRVELAARGGQLIQRSVVRTGFRIAAVHVEAVRQTSCGVGNACGGGTDVHVSIQR